MNDLLWARSTMALSLGFHIVFASISMVLPFFMALAHWRYLRHGSPLDLRLTKAWAKGAAVIFATGAVSGTALSFQLGLLWPGFMEHAGPIFGMPFSLEGAAFFLEAIFFGLFLYGWDRLTPRVHFWTGVLVGVCGLLSGVLVIAANGWMNSPSGFVWMGDHAEKIDPWAAMFNRAWPLQALHMLVAAIQATAFGAAGIHAMGLLKEVRSKASPTGTSAHPPTHVAPHRGTQVTSHPRTIDFHRRALAVLMPFAVGASLIQPLIGDASAKSVAIRQPEKLAAFEAHYESETRAGLLIGGLVDDETGQIRYGIKIPGALSILAHGDINAEVTGLRAFAPEDRPPVLIPHLAFQTMVGLGTLLAAVSAFWLFARWRKPSWLEHPRFLQLLILLLPSGFVALEAGWVVTEVGRQPWILYRVLRTATSVTPVPGLHVTFLIILAVYGTLAVLSFAVLRRIYQLEIDQIEAENRVAPDVAQEPQIP